MFLFGCRTSGGAVCPCAKDVRFGQTAIEGGRFLLVGAAFHFGTGGGALCKNQLWWPFVGIESALCGLVVAYISADLKLEVLIEGEGCSALFELLSLISEAIVLELL